MAISAKGKRKFHFRGVLYLWWCDEDEYLFRTIHILTQERDFGIHYRLPDNELTPPLLHFQVPFEKQNYHITCQHPPTVHNPQGIFTNQSLFHLLTWVERQTMGALLHSMTVRAFPNQSVQQDIKGAVLEQLQKNITNGTEPT